MIKFDIKNRWTGKVQFTAEIDCDESEATSVKIGLAVKWAVEVRANLAGAYLAGANLARAYLADADLADAYLAGANLAGAKIIRKVAQIRRDDGYEFLAFALDDGRLFVRAGCRSMTVADFRAHVANEYPGTSKAVETLAILDFIELRHAARSTDQ